MDRWEDQQELFDFWGRWGLEKGQDLGFGETGDFLQGHCLAYELDPCGWEFVGRLVRVIGGFGVITHFKYNQMFIYYANTFEFYICMHISMQ